MNSFGKKVRHPFKGLHVTFNGICQLFIHPPLGMTAAKINQVSVVVRVNENIVRFPVSPYDLMRMKTLQSIQGLIEPFSSERGMLGIPSDRN